MTIRQRFKAAIAGIRKRAVEPDPFPGHPGVSEYDASIIVGEAARRTYEDVEFEGPGAEAAKSRRDAAIARMDARKTVCPEVKSEVSLPPKKKARRMTRRERLEKKAADLRAEIARLKK